MASDVTQLSQFQGSNIVKTHITHQVLNIVTAFLYMKFNTLSTLLSRIYQTFDIQKWPKAVYFTGQVVIMAYLQSYLKRLVIW